jgi:hypothetical protein
MILWLWSKEGGMGKSGMAEWLLVMKRLHPGAIQEGGHGACVFVGPDENLRLFKEIMPPAERLWDGSWGEGHPSSAGLSAGET